MEPDTARLLLKALLLFDDKPRFQLRRGGLDSFVVAAEISKHLGAHGYSRFDPTIQPPPATRR
jgi:hypothetical protein